MKKYRHFQQITWIAQWRLHVWCHGRWRSPWLQPLNGRKTTEWHLYLPYLSSAAVLIFGLNIHLKCEITEWTGSTWPCTYWYAVTAHAHIAMLLLKQRMKIEYQYVIANHIYMQRHVINACRPSAPLSSTKHRFYLNWNAPFTADDFKQKSHCENLRAMHLRKTLKGQQHNKNHCCLWSVSPCDTCACDGEKTDRRTQEGGIKKRDRARDLLMKSCVLSILLAEGSHWDAGQHRRRDSIAFIAGQDKTWTFRKKRKEKK